MSHSSYLNKYLTLRNKIDNESNKLEQMHKSQMVCNKGCDSCCESLTIFPIEYYTIKEDIKKLNNLPKNKLWNSITKSCRFLVNGECAIYESRPIICRTQGLPILYKSIKGENFELSICKLNFTNSEASSFNMDNSLYMSPLNSQLFIMNTEFIEENFKGKYKPTDRLKLNNIK